MAIHSTEVFIRTVVLVWKQFGSSSSSQLVENYMRVQRWRLCCHRGIQQRVPLSQKNRMFKHLQVYL